MRYLARLLSVAREAAQQVGPYLAIEILLPGGTLIALALFLYRRRAANAVGVGHPERLGVFGLLSGIRARTERALAWLSECVRGRLGGGQLAHTAAQ